MIYNTNSDKYWYWDIEQAGYIWNMDENRDLCIGGKHWQLRTAIFRSDFFDLILSKYSFCNTGSVYSINLTSADMDSESPDQLCLVLVRPGGRQRTADRHWIEFSAKSGQKRDKNRTRPGLFVDVRYKFYPYSRYAQKQETKIVIIKCPVTVFWKSIGHKISQNQPIPSFNAALKN